MTPKEKAQELVNKFDHISLDIDYSGVKDAVIICVNEIISICTQYKFIEYWNKVKKEIELL